nr:DMT family transporter [Candidatus Odyssella thessalonicensis]
MSALNGIFWFLLSLIVSNCNDVIMKAMGQSLPTLETIFLRFLFAALSLLPCLLSLKIFNFKIHLIRGVLLFCGITLWCYGIQRVPLSVASILGFTLPLFTLPLAYFFLKEQVCRLRWLATIIGFLGITIIVIPSIQTFSWVSVTILISSLIFAVLDTINKRFIIKECFISILFSSALIVTLLSAIPSYYIWQPPTLRQLLLLFISGLASNLMSYCILKSFQYMEASALAPYRYFEPVLASFFGFIFFQEFPSTFTLLGAAIILPMTGVVTFYEVKIKSRNLKRIKLNK